MEFQVTSSSAATGKNDIVTRIYSPPPTLSILYESDLENDGSFNGEAEENGDYKVCFDNQVSTWSDKILWFEVIVEEGFRRKGLGRFMMKVLEMLCLKAD